MDYIGETEKRARDRFAEHHRKCMIEKSSMAHQAHYNNQSISNQNYEIIDRESECHRRVIKQAIYISKARTPPENRDAIT